MKKAISILAALAMTAASALCAVSAEALRVTMRNHGMAGDEYYVEYCKDYLDKYDLNGDGFITAYDFNEAERRQEEQGEAYTGVRSSELAVFMANVDNINDVFVRRGDYNRDGSLNALDMAASTVYAQACERDGVEFPGYVGEAFSKRFGLPWVGPDPYVMGDLNDDNVLNARDVTVLMKIILDGPKNDIQFYRADLNNDNVVNARDVSVLMRMIMR